MISLSAFRKNLFKTFALMRDTKLEIDVYHRRKVYRVKVEETGQKVTTPYRTKRRITPVADALLDTKPCDQCDSMVVNGVCMNKQCPSNAAKAVTL